MKKRLSQRSRDFLDRRDAVNAAGDHQTWYRTQYLKSPEWLDKRATALRQARFKCRICGSAAELDVHHTTYARLGYEDPTDLRVLCRTCHNGR